MAGAHAARRHARAARLPASTPTSCAAADHARGPRCILLNSPHNPTGKVFTRAELDAHRRGSASSTTCSSSPTRSTSTSSSTASTSRSRRCPGCASARSRSRRAARRSRSPAGRSAGSCAPAGARRRGPDREAVPHLREQRRRSSTRSRSASTCPTRTSPTFAAELREQARPALRRAGRRRASTVLRPHGTYFVTVDIRSLGETDGLAFCRALPERCGVVAVPNVVFYDDVDAGAPLVRFAFCKRTEVLDEASALKALQREGLATMIVAGGPARHRVGGPRRELRAPRADDRGAAAAGARLVVLTEMFSTGFSMDDRPHRRAGRRPEHASSSSSRRAAHGVWVCGVGARARRRPRASVQPARARRARRRPRTATPRSTRSPTAASTSTTPPATEFLTVDIEGVRCRFFVCYDLRFADEFWALAPTTDCYVVPANWPASRREHWLALLARARDREPGVRRRREPRRRRRRARVRRRQSRSSTRSVEIVAEAAGTEALLVADVDPAVVTDTRRRFPFLQDRR